MDTYCIRLRNGRQLHRPASRTPLRTATFSLQRRSAVHQPSQRAASAVTARCIVTCSALRFTQASAATPALPTCLRTFTPPDCTHYSTGKPGARDFSKKRRILFQEKRKAFRSTPRRLFQASKETLTITEECLYKWQRRLSEKLKKAWPRAEGGCTRERRSPARESRSIRPSLRTSAKAGSKLTDRYLLPAFVVHICPPGTTYICL